MPLGRRSKPKSYVGVVGPRDWPHHFGGQIEETIKNILAAGECVATGDCPTGVDRFAAMYSNAHGHKPRVYVADWTKYKAKAGPFRNGRLVRGIDRLVAFWHPNVKGTKDCIAQALEVGIPVAILPLSYFTTVLDDDGLERHFKLMDSWVEMEKM